MFASRRSQSSPPSASPLPFLSISIFLTRLLLRDFVQGQTVGIFGIFRRHQPRALALPTRPKRSNDENQKEHSGSRAPNKLIEQISKIKKGKTSETQESVQTSVSTPISFGVRIRGVIPLLRSSSNSSSWPMKLRLGEMMGLLVLTNL